MSFNSPEGIWIERGSFWSPGRVKSEMKWYEEWKRDWGRVPVRSGWEGRLSGIERVEWEDLQYRPLQNRGIGPRWWRECKCWSISSEVDAWLINEYRMNDIQLTETTDKWESRWVRIEWTNRLELKNDNIWNLMISKSRSTIEYSITERTLLLVLRVREWIYMRINFYRLILNFRSHEWIELVWFDDSLWFR